MHTKAILYRASILHFPVATQTPDTQAIMFEDGALVILNEKIIVVGNYAQVSPLYSGAEIIDYSGRLLVPGLIDSHLHYPQTEMIAKYGKQLLAWLENYTFPTERKFESVEYCEHIAHIFLRQLIDNGTTTALAFSTVHKQSVDTLFKAASALNMAIVTGKVCMDRHCPAYLQDTPASAQYDSNELIARWHGKGRSLYALTPRFAPTSSSAQLAALSELAQQYPDVFVQTHLSENAHEVEWVKNLYPEYSSYLDVYASFNMVRKRAVFGHCLHLSQDEWTQIAESGATVAFCPTSNLFLGSGLFDIQTAQEHKVNIALATDVGAGTSFNMLRTYGEAYKVSQLRNAPISPLEGLYMMTQGPAHAYDLSGSIGNLNPGTYADFIILNPHFNSLSQLRMNEASSADDILFALSVIGDDRAVEATYIAGKQQKISMEKSYALA
ncbi:MAG: guanine deaminase [Alphaproteobacteria bacterium]